METLSGSTDGTPSTVGPRVARRPTMKDVAALAGVSLSTVSRAVNGTAVDADLAARVHEASRLLGYRRDHAASTLRRADRHSASVGLIFDDVSNPFSSAVHRGFEDVARGRGVLTFAGSSDQDPEREQEMAHALFSRRVDGLIVVPAGPDHGYLRREREAGVAIVFVDRPPSAIDADVVLTDNAGGTAAGVGHLIAIGHRRIGYLGDRSALHTAMARLEGYRAALAAHAIAYDPAVVRLELGSSAASRAAAEELLELPDPPTALFAGQNLVTIGAVSAPRRTRRLRRPHPR